MDCKEKFLGDPEKHETLRRRSSTYYEFLEIGKEIFKGSRSRNKEESDAINKFVSSKSKLIGEK